MQVTKLAQAQSNISKTYSATTTDLVGEGTIHIQLGTWGAGDSFTAKPGATAIDIPVGPPAKSLAEVRDMVNAADAGITATVLSDASGARLVFRSSTTGAPNGFKISVTDVDGSNVDTSGLSALAYDPSVGVVTMSQALAATNASALINGAPVSSVTNTLTNVVDGMTLQLQQETTSAVQITTAADKDAISKKIASLRQRLQRPQRRIGDANEVRRRKQDGRHAAGRQRRGVAAREPAQHAARRERCLDHLHTPGQHRLRRAAGWLHQARQHEARQRAGQSRELKKLFSNTDAVVSANNGFATLFRNQADQALGVGGTIATRTDGLRTSISRNEQRQASSRTASRRPRRDCANSTPRWTRRWASCRACRATSRSRWPY